MKILLFCLAIVISMNSSFCMQSELDKQYLKTIDDSLQMLSQITNQPVAEHEKLRVMQEVSAKLENLKAVTLQDNRHLPADDPNFGGPINHRID